ncbi:hypothetical protein LCGC14_1189730 [marine sediment metagenome]|uniref:Uncharacterized protein n=1 Tax=marine sediment metagenome TaxID=412755 RepID=A0A0F9PQ76_9ZZZZ
MTPIYGFSIATRNDGGYIFMFSRGKNDKFYRRPIVPRALKQYITNQDLTALAQFEDGNIYLHYGLEQ